MSLFAILSLFVAFRSLNPTYHRAIALGYCWVLCFNHTYGRSHLLEMPSIQPTNGLKRGILKPEVRVQRLTYILLKW
ncbi:MAG: hypothetical protein V7L02_31475 [Nostoc sp.]|uniref:hypothetical protein n=1 Tax=Nostoc sp. TaxID=1180 RepID=UPI002FFBA2B8